MKKKKWLRYLYNVDYAIAGVCLMALIFFTIFGVVMRYVMNDPLTWLEEIQFILVVQVAFWGASAGCKNNEHIAIEVIVEMLPAKIQKVFEWIIGIVVLLILALLAQQQFMRAVDLYYTGRTTNILHFPVFINYASVSIACVFMMVHYVLYWVKNYKEKYICKGGNGQ
ncbi:MAG: TRAP transporter small permease [Eubacteriales bacterium]|jgi:C4-dicarboxylate transporter DctQ subunit